MKTRWLRHGALVATLLLVLAACGDDDSADSTDATDTSVDATDGPDTGSDGTGGPETLTVGVDLTTPDYPIASFAYFPTQLTAHPGDTVSFESVWTGEPHTVTLGTLVDEGVPAYDPETGEEPESLTKIPPLLPEGPGDAIQASAQPCFLGAGEDPPAEEACTPDQQEQPAFDGTSSFYNSGFLPEGAVFDVELAEDLEPGTYYFFCALHRADMSGSITVVAPEEEADTAADVDEARAAAEDELVAALAPIAEAAATGTLPGLVEGGPGQVLAGAADETSPALVASFGPEDTTVATGDTVTWTIIGPHTVTFGATEAERAAIFKAPDGAVHVNPDSFGPAGGEGQPEPDPTAEPGPPIDIDGGTYDGTGYLNSGLVVSFPPQLYTYTVAFSTPGTYEYFCLIHPEMTGTVTVT